MIDAGLHSKGTNGTLHLQDGKDCNILPDNGRNCNRNIDHSHHQHGGKGGIFEREAPTTHRRTICLEEYLDAIILKSIVLYNVHIKTTESGSLSSRRR